MKYYVAINNDPFVVCTSFKEAKKLVKGINGIYSIYSKKELMDLLMRCVKVLNEEK